MDIYNVDGNGDQKDFLVIADLVFLIALVVFVFATICLLVVFGVYKLSKRSPLTSSSSAYFSSSGYDPDEVLPSGWRRRDYHEYGLTDFDIECWGMDQPDAPEPATSGFAIMDMADGDFDGDIDPWY